MLVALCGCFQNVKAAFCEKAVSSNEAVTRKTDTTIFDLLFLYKVLEKILEMLSNGVLLSIKPNSETLVS